MGATEQFSRIGMMGRAKQMRDEANKIQIQMDKLDVKETKERYELKTLL
jgi:hypothetical protein